ncbi:MAG: M1 family metallopeptidase [Saprospiraceae bacterium]|nr:M1 family metallopeptidase [Saprospiraceae bacterium]
MRIFLLIASLSLLAINAMLAQQVSSYTMDDTLSGTITPERAWWDLTFYDLFVRLDVERKSIAGHNMIRYEVLSERQQHMQIDLQPPLVLERAEQDGLPLAIKRIGKNAYWLTLEKVQRRGSQEAVTVWYSGIPREALRAPWDGGFSWSKDQQGRPFIATSCQGLGASVWWPCKDHPYDEPDSQRISINVPEPLVDVSNGRLRKVTPNPDGTRTFEWFVANPLNNYGVNLNVAEYAHFADTFQGEKGVLDLNYYVLQENLAKAQQHFKQVKGMLRAFEYWFGPYPFYEDGYKLVEVPYLGMEHQSSVTYGNNYLNGYRGTDLSKTGWGLKWDFIIVHESGHEWFANNITYSDNADMWIHESFTNYSESLYTEYHFGKQAGAEYVRGCRRLIENQKPIIPPYGVNADGPLDMYYKGGNFLHTLRQVADNESLWREILRGLNRDFYHQTVSSAQVEEYISKAMKRDLSKVFDQYLRHADVPVLEYRMKHRKLEYRWINCVRGFDMPVKVALSPGKYTFIYPDTEWKHTRYKWKKKEVLDIDPDFYVESRKL